MKRYIKASEYSHLDEFSSEIEFIRSEVNDEYLDDVLNEVYLDSDLSDESLESVINYTKTKIYQDLINGDYYDFSEELDCIKRNKGLIFKLVEQYVKEHYDDFDWGI